MLIDPLIPSEAREEFLAWLDGRVEGRQVSILTTIRWHRRDRDELAGRYVPGDSEDAWRPRARAWNEIPEGVSARWLKGAGEIVFWLPGAAALVPGDSLIGAGEGRLRVCPESWLEDVERRSPRPGRAARGAASSFRLERVLASHGDRFWRMAGGPLRSPSRRPKRDVLPDPRPEAGRIRSQAESEYDVGPRARYLPLVAVFGAALGGLPALATSAGSTPNINGPRNRRCGRPPK